MDGFEPLNLGSGVDCSTIVLPQLGIKTHLVTLYSLFSKIGNLSVSSDGTHYR
jgi:hypothetical protein